MRVQVHAAQPDPRQWRPDLPTADNDDLLRWYWAAAQVLRPDPVCVELGVAYGRSLLYLAYVLLGRGCPGSALYGVDPWGRPPPGDGSGGTVPSVRGVLGGLHCHGLDGELALIRLIGVPSVQAARLWEPASLDLVEIDGDHTYAGVHADIEAYLPLIRPGGILAGHDYGDQYPGVRQAVDELLGRRVHHYQRMWWVEYPEG